MSHSKYFIFKMLNWKCMRFSFEAWYQAIWTKTLLSCSSFRREKRNSWSI